METRWKMSGKSEKQSNSLKRYNNFWRKPAVRRVYAGPLALLFDDDDDDDEEEEDDDDDQYVSVVRGYCRTKQKLVSSVIWL